MKNLLIRFIKFYQKNISANTSSKCKYFPTCSNYAVEALQIHGFFKGTLLAIWRVLRCNPFSRGGYDPVPEKKKKRGNS
ncbi:MAG: membrane protein insertion efficiency factor YidD [Ruminococcus sp.]|nr:membrane protein insertion efficiency factor YidD [Ruminococcus sp.]